MNNNPLVTVGILTYNSSKYISETLDSILSQSYRNIELIISDDNSSDSTIDIINLWLEKNQTSFIHPVKFLKVDHNTGTSGNCNRILKNASGEWIKFLAGDDLLIKDAIKSYIDYISNNIDVKVCFAESIHFTGNPEDEIFSFDSLEHENYLFNPKMTAKKQYNILCKHFIGSGPTSFFNTNILREVGGFDERFQLQEDYPIFIKIAKQGNMFHLLKQYTVYKRVDDESVSHSKNRNAIYTNLQVRCVIDYRYEYKMEELGALWRLFLLFSLFISRLVINTGNSYDNLLSRSIYYIQKLVDPFCWYSRYLKYINYFYKSKA